MNIQEEVAYIVGRAQEREACFVSLGPLVFFSTWTGDAWMWYGNAQAMGYAVGKAPEPGSIMVTWESPIFGHVAYVEEVYADGSFLVSEMNYKGFGIVDYRHICPGQVPLIGFVY